MNFGTKNLQNKAQNCLFRLCTKRKEMKTEKSERKKIATAIEKASVNAENVKLKLKEKKHVSY